MTLVEFIYGSVYIGIAILLALGIIVGFGVLLQAEQKFGSWSAPFVIPVVTIGICVSTLLSGRSLKYASLDLSLQTAGVGAGGGWLLRLFTVTLLAMCMTAVASHWFRRAEPLPKSARHLFIAFTVFFVCNSVLNSAFGTEPAFIHNLLYPIVIFSAAYVTSRSSLSAVVLFAKISLAAMMLLSLAAAVVLPDMAVQPNYKGWIPGLNSRLWGIGSNANSIGPLALVLLLLEYMQPYRRWWIRWPVVLMAGIVFVYAQSKTVYAAAAGLAFILLWYRMSRNGKGLDMRFVIGIVFLASGMLATLMVLDVGRLWDRLLYTQAGTDIATLTGRWQIWTVAVTEWLRNPLFGYGPEIWGPEFRQRIGMQFAFSAHNQFMQSLSSAGTLGAASMVIYVLYLGRGAFANRRETNGVSVGLFALLMVRCMTEAPLTLLTMFNGDFITHLLMFHIAVRASIGQTNAEAQRPLQNAPALA